MELKCIEIDSKNTRLKSWESSPTNVLLPYWITYYLYSDNKNYHFRFYPLVQMQTYLIRKKDAQLISNCSNILRRATSGNTATIVDIVLGLEGKRSRLDQILVILLVEDIQGSIHRSYEQKSSFLSWIHSRIHSIPPWLSVKDSSLRLSFVVIMSDLPRVVDLKIVKSTTTIHLIINKINTMWICVCNILDSQYSLEHRMFSSSAIMTLIYSYFEIIFSAVLDIINLDIILSENSFLNMK